ncbi:hypothetical protein M9H77_35337 [Catharanthus roseus]|uniref:Uncharacterized protein n=1 Tax=Catharanthus roseus TaxID=4058 RepID=A0ACB9ZQW0_CATRO|nr:hypothetical protein M9H77_35337 [Catharanthus roseus]
MGRGWKRKDPEPSTQQDTLSSTQMNPQTPAQQDPLTPIKRDPPTFPTLPISYFVPTMQPSSSMAPFTDPAAWKLSPCDTRQLLTLNSEVPPDVHDMWWGEFHTKHFVNGIKEIGLKDRGGGEGGLEGRKHKSSSISFIEHQGYKKGQYVDSYSEEFWAWQKAEEKTAATDAPLPNDLQLLATLSGELDRSQLYEVGFEAAHLRAMSSQATAGLPLYCLEAEQRIIRRVEAAISSVRTA